MAIIPQDNINITDWKNTSLIEELKFNWSSNRCREELFTDESWMLLTKVFSSHGKFWVAQFLLLSMTFFSLSQNMFAVSGFNYTVAGTFYHAFKTFSLDTDSSACFPGG